MKKLNKKGFTLVELLAVIVILALLIIVVANTALPAMQSAREDALNTYAKRVCEKAKEKCMSDYITSGTATCEFDGLDDLMGSDNAEYKISTTIKGSVDTNGVNFSQGAIQDENGKLDPISCS